MRLFTSVFIIAFLAGISETLTQQWWMIAVAAFLVLFFYTLPAGMSFLAGFLGIAVLWTVHAIMPDMANQHILSQRMAVLFHLPSSGTFIVVTVLVGSLLGGLAGWSGSLIRGSFFPKT
jgi:hypothetical protein